MKKCQTKHKFYAYMMFTSNLCKYTYKLFTILIQSQICLIQNTLSKNLILKYFVF